MRVDCPVEGYEDCYMDFSEKWTRSEIRAFVGGAKNDEFFALLQSKLTALRLKSLKGVVVDTPSKLNDKFADDLQWEVFQWFMGVPQRVVNGVLNVGEAIRRQSSQTSEETEEQA
jgi:hypothetical protein